MSLAGRRVLVTGAAGGIGAILVQKLLEEGADVVAHARDAARLPAGAEHVVADLSVLADAVRLAEVEVDVVVHNAGLGFGAHRKTRETSADGYELRFAVNYLAPFAIDERLSSRVKVVVAVASAGQAPLDLERDPMTEKPYDGVLAYRRSKLAMVMDTFERARRDRDRVYVALHPGTFLATKMVREAGIEPMGTAESGAEAVLSATRGALDGSLPSGTYLDVRTPTKADPSAYDVEAQRRLRERSLEWVARALSASGSRSPAGRPPR